MDFKLYELGDGGELNIIGGDIEPENTLLNAIYLSLFSGDNWYNIFETEDNNRTTDEFETALFELETSSSNLKKLETIARENLNWLINDGIVDSIETRAIPNSNGHINLSIMITEPNNISKKYMIVWEAQKLYLKESR